MMIVREWRGKKQNNSSSSFRAARQAAQPLTRRPGIHTPGPVVLHRRGDARPNAVAVVMDSGLARSWRCARPGGRKFYSYFA